MPTNPVHHLTKVETTAVSCQIVTDGPGSVFLIKKLVARAGHAMARRHYQASVPDMQRLHALAIGELWIVAFLTMQETIVFPRGPEAWSSTS